MCLSSVLVCALTKCVYLCTMSVMCIYSLILIYEFFCVAVLRLLKEGVDPNTPISSGGSLLHLVKSSVMTTVHYMLHSCAAITVNSVSRICQNQYSTYGI